MERPLKILFLASWYPNKTDPFFGNFVQRHAEAISQNHEIFVVAAFPAPDPSVDRVQKGNLTEIVVYYRNEIPLFSYLWAMSRAIRQVRNLGSEFDLCHVNVAWPAGLLALYLRLPYVVTEHFSGYLPVSKHKWPPLSRLFVKRILSKASCVMPVSNYLKDGIAKFAPKANFQVIPNVVNESLFHYSPPPKSGTFTFLHISTLENKSKNIHGMLDSLYKAIRKGRRDFKLLIGGDGDLMELDRLIHHNVIPSSQIEVFSSKKPDEVAEMMSKSHALLMFSHYETQSCTILEALCSGRPVVTSKVGGIPEITDESNSIQVTDDDRIGLAKAVEKMIDTYDNYDFNEIANQAEQKYSYRSVAEKYYAVYANALKKESSNH